MTTLDNSSSHPIVQSPLLLGVIVDVSSSMRRNWQNQDGKKLPRIEVIRDAINKQIKEKQKHRQGQIMPDDIELFCLGMGFCTVAHVNGIELSYDRERQLGNSATYKMTDWICIMALEI